MAELKKVQELLGYLNLNSSYEKLEEICADAGIKNQTPL